LVPFGYLQSSYDSTEGGVVVISTGQTTPRTFVSLGTASDTVAIQGFNGSIFSTITVAPAGITFSPGAAGGVYYKNASGFLAAIASGAGFLKSAGGGAVPAWAGITIGDVSGTVPINKGGTGTASPPTTGTLLIGKTDGTYAIASLTQGTNITITPGDGTLTIAAASTSATPAPSPGNIQYNNAGSFGGIANTSVSGSDVTFGGKLTVQSATSVNKQLVVDPTATNMTVRMVEFGGTSALPTLLRFERSRGTGSTDVASGDVIGKIEFQGRRTSLTTFGVIQASYDTTEGGVIQMSTGQATPRTFIAMGTLSDTVTIQGFNGSTFNTITVGPSGIAMTPGAAGDVYYKNSSGFLAAVASGAGVLQSTGGGAVPTFGAVNLASASYVTGILPIANHPTITIAKGGTGNTATPTAGYILQAISGTQYAPAQLVQGTNITITNVAGTITIDAATGGGGAFPQGIANELQYRSNGTTFGALAIGATGTFLKATGGTLPVYSAITVSDWTGTVPISKGGTGITAGPTLTPSTSAQFLLALSSGNWQVGTLAASGTCSLSYSGGTLTIVGAAGGGGAPGSGANNTLQ
jgi:hypothetical protein